MPVQTSNIESPWQRVLVEKALVLAQQLERTAAQTVGGVGLSSGVYDSKATGGSGAARENITKVTELLAKGEFDLVGVGRAIMHDPHWVRRVRQGEDLLPFDENARLVLT